MLKNLNSLVSLCKRRGYIFPSSEIYGGLSACWDYGPLGAQFKINVKEHWWKEMTYRADVVGLDSSILMHPSVWKASGHVDGFSDPLVDCKDCRFRFRMEKGIKSCPKCGSKNLTEPRDFNLMFKTHAGPVEDEAGLVYLRPETAQGIYVNFFKYTNQYEKKKFRSEWRKWEKLLEMRSPWVILFFVAGSLNKWRCSILCGRKQRMNTLSIGWKKEKNFLQNIGLPESSLRPHEHNKEELAHYAHKAVDWEFLFPIGWKELEGIHNRGDFDLTQHQKLSGKKLSYFDAEKNSSYVPWVIETSIGLDRLILALLCSAYKEEKVEAETRVLLSLNPAIAPVQTAVLPLSKKESLTNLADKINGVLSKKWRVEYDETGSIGKRYRRQDEIGTPFCVTVDFDSLSDEKVTVRHRDTMKQDRLLIDQLPEFMNKAGL